ncbi:MAG TPA: hypothetical protein PKV86_06930 [Syntrophobacteraceae bacterium]|nr:hypothetical protein [Syntrophobacteraceae bacterium]
MVSNGYKNGKAPKRHSCMFGAGMQVLESPLDPNAVELSGTSLRGAVTPAKAGVQKILKSLDSGFRWNDAQGFNREILAVNSTTLPLDPG